MRTEAPVIEEVSGEYTSSFLDTDELSKNRFTGPKSFQGFREEQRNQKKEIMIEAQIDTHEIAGIWLY